MKDYEVTTMGALDTEADPGMLHEQMGSIGDWSDFLPSAEDAASFLINPINFVTGKVVSGTVAGANAVINPAKPAAKPKPPSPTSSAPWTAAELGPANVPSASDDVGSFIDENATAIAVVGGGVLLAVFYYLNKKKGGSMRRRSRR